VQKSALGRNLGTLLGRGSVEGPPVGSLPPRTQIIGPGVRSLMRGTQAESPFAEPVAATTSVTIEKVKTQSAQTVPRWYLFAGDVLLVALALFVFFRNPKPTWKEELFAIIIVALGGVLGALAVGYNPASATPFQAEQPPAT
jgi:hypothetical protein